MIVFRAMRVWLGFIAYSPLAIIAHQCCDCKRRARGRIYFPGQGFAPLRSRKRSLRSEVRIFLLKRRSGSGFHA